MSFSEQGHSPYGEQLCIAPTTEHHGYMNLYRNKTDGFLQGYNTYPTEQIAVRHTDEIAGYSYFQTVPVHW